MVLLLAACGGDSGSSEAREAGDSDVGPSSMSHDQNSARPLAWAVDHEPEITVGVFNGPEEQQLVAVSGAARLSTGEIVVADQGARTVRMYDGEGRFLRTLGRPGSGPGEFEDPAIIVVTPEDAIGIWDGALFRLTWFDPEGALARVDPVDLAAIAKTVDPPLYPASAKPLDDGRLLVHLIDKGDLKGGLADPGERTRPRSGALIVSGDLSRIDTLAFFPGGEELWVEAPWGTQALPAPLPTTTSIADGGSPSTVCVGDPGESSIRCFPPDGEDRILKVVTEPPPPLTRELDTWKLEIAAFWGSKVSEADHQRIMRRVELPDRRPSFASIHLDPVGYLWVEIGPTGNEVGDPKEFQIYGPEGGYLGRIEVPPVRLFEVGEDYLIGLHTDELDVESVRVFRIERVGEG